MALQILADDEHYVVKARMGEPYAAHEILPGLEAHTFNNVNSMPKTFVPHCYWDRHADVFLTDAQTPNPYHYKQEQRKVLEWAHRSIHDPTFQVYARHGHQVRADIFHVFAVMNVMAALHVPNILGAHWDRVTSNLVSWQDFTRRIRIDDWTQAGVFNYATFIATPVNRFVPLRSSFRIGGVIINGTRQITIDPRLLSRVGDILPINQG